MTREEFESILEEAFNLGQDQAEIDSYEETMLLELNDMFNSYNEAGSIPSPSELIKTIKEKITNHPKVKKFFKEHPEEEAKKKKFIDKYSNSAKALYKKDVNFAIGTSFISFIVGLGVLLTIFPFASLPSGLPGLIISGGIGAVVGLIQNGVTTKFILSKLKSAEGKAVRDKYEKSVTKNNPGIIGRVIARNAALDDFYKKSYKEEFDLEDEYNQYYNESLGLDDKRELNDAFEMMKKKGMSKKGISLNARLNVAQRAAKVGYFNKDDKNPYISEKSANKYGAKFMDHLRKNPDDAKKFVQAKTRLNGGSYKRNLEKMKRELY